MTSQKTYDINFIMEAMPHRYPFLLVDKIVNFESGKRIVAVKNVTISEPYFGGHFPGFPLVPGVLLVESLAQAGGLLLLLSATPEQREQHKHRLLAGIDNARFRRPVVPGDQVFLIVTLDRQVRQFSRLQAHAEVDGQIVCETALTLAQRREQDSGS